MTWEPVIGLEIHVQLSTRTKMFCACALSFGEPPNTRTCPVCLGHPGTLPTLNAQAVHYGLMIAFALGCEVAPRSIFHRKNYFYPDLPKGYQITQFDQPICEHGKLAIDLEGGEKVIRIARIHMEEDAGKNIHDASAGESLVDLNRAGTPLLEIVSAPDLRSSDEAVEYLKNLRDVLVYLGVNDGNLEEGSFRCDANVSVMRKGTEKFGTRVELKNINSFRFIKQAIEFEIERQVEEIEAGRAIVQETRLWDTGRNETRSMRSKEEAHDYRYFPEPDLPPLVLREELVTKTRETLPELPRPKLQRFVSQYGLPAYDAKILISERPLADYFEKVAAEYKDAKKLSNWFMGELLRMLKEEGGTVATLKFQPAQFAALLGAVDKGTISNNAGKDVFAEMFRTGKDPQAIISEKGLAQVSDTGAIEKMVDEVLAANAGEVEKYKAGKKQVFGFLVGQVMKAMKGKGNPQLVNAALKKRLGD